MDGGGSGAELIAYFPHPVRFIREFLMEHVQDRRVLLKHHELAHEGHGVHLRFCQCPLAAVAVEERGNGFVHMLLHHVVHGINGANHIECVPAADGIIGIDNAEGIAFLVIQHVIRLKIVVDEAEHVAGLRKQGKFFCTASRALFKQSGAP